ncbi:MAG: addiction module protein [Labilithrix sp.]
MRVVVSGHDIEDIAAGTAETASKGAELRSWSPKLGSCAILFNVNARAQKLLDEVLELPAEDRDAFAAKLLEKLDAPPDTRTDEEWAVELERRAAEALDPNWRGRSWDEVRAEVERSLRVPRGG